MIGVSRVGVLLAAGFVCAGCWDGSNTSADTFRLVTQLDVGENPHQISFSDDGRTAWVATAAPEPT